MQAPFFRALDALAVDDCGSGARLASGGFATLRVERVVDAIERGVATPAIEVIVKRRTWRQVLRDGAPLAAGAEYVHQAVDDLALIDMASVAAALGRRNERLDMRPFRVGQIARITQSTAVVASAIFVGPHRRPPQFDSGRLLNHKRFQRFVNFPDGLLAAAPAVSRNGTGIRPAPTHNTACSWMIFVIFLPKSCSISLSIACRR